MTLRMKKTRDLVLTALFAALIFVATYSIKMPLAQGYIHFGDAFIYITACLLPLPYAAVAAAFGGALSDALSGYAIYIIPTLIIKALLVIPFTCKKEKLINTRNILAPILAGVIGLLGYFTAETILYGAGTAFANAIMGSIQPVGSLFIFYAVAYIFDKLSLKDKINMR